MKLNWKTHIDDLSQKLADLTYLLRKLLQFATTQVLRQAYDGIFQSKIALWVKIG